MIEFCIHVNETSEKIILRVGYLL